MPAAEARFLALAGERRELVPAMRRQRRSCAACGDCAGRGDAGSWRRQRIPRVRAIFAPGRGAASGRGKRNAPHASGERLGGANDEGIDTTAPIPMEHMEGSLSIMRKDSNYKFNQVEKKQERDLNDAAASLTGQLNGELESGTETGELIFSSKEDGQVKDKNGVEQTWGDKTGSRVLDIGSNTLRNEGNLVRSSVDWSPVNSSGVTVEEENEPTRNLRTEESEVLQGEVGYPILRAQEDELELLVSVPVEEKPVVLTSEEEELGSSSKSVQTQQESPDKDSDREERNAGGDARCIAELMSKFKDLPQKEALRRSRISAANVGRIPWNKGKKLSSDTLQRIKEGTRRAMQRPDVRSKMINAYNRRIGHSAVTKAKISSSMKMYHEKLRKQLGLTMTARDAQRLQAAARSELRKQQRIEKAEAKRRAAIKRKQNQQNPSAPSRSMLHRARISAAVRAKWQDPDYRAKTIKGIQSSQERRMATIKGVTRRQGAATAQRRHEQEFNAERVRKLEHTKAIIRKLEVGIQDLEAQRLILQSDHEAVKEIDQVLEESRRTLEEVRAMLAPIEEDVRELAQPDSINSAIVKENDQQHKSGLVLDS